MDLSNPFNLFKVLFSTPKSSFRTGKDRIAIIYAVGAITTGKGGRSLLGGDTVGSTTIVEAIRKAEDDPQVKAIVLRVDSPGGSALASDLIWRELQRCKKPVIASMSDVAASGGYYISMGARKIFAQPGTLTGSIGVVGGKLALGGLYDKIGITTETISRGANAGIFSTVHAFSPSERKALEKLMEDTYDQFLSKAMAGRAAPARSSRGPRCSRSPRAVSGPASKRWSWAWSIISARWMTRSRRPSIWRGWDAMPIPII